MTRLRSRKEEWLLALLTLRAGKEVSRDWLAGTLWPDNLEEQSLAYLRQTLYHLKKALGEEASRLESPDVRSLRLDLTGAFVDLFAFDEALQRNDTYSLKEAITLYRGPLLEGCNEEWAHLERQHREQAYLSALETHAQRTLAEGEPAAALSSLRLLIQADPLRESAHRSLMQALADDGDYAAMTLAYRDLRLMLRRELNTDPSPESAALYHQLRDQARQKAAAQPLSDSLPGAAAPPVRTAPGEAPQALDASLSSPIVRIPRPLTRLIGREEDLIATRGCLATAPLVTLTGTGGVGKTRVALEVAQAWAREQKEDVWFVELAPVSSESNVSQAVAKTLGVMAEKEKPLDETLADFLASRRALLVLDNCEHLLSGCAALCVGLLRLCPDLRILTTSRQSLRVLGEVTYPVLPLEAPPAPSSQTEEEADKEQISACMEYASVRLFVERAQAVSPAFRLTLQNVAAVAGVCRCLDGIPLAIELAAARVKALSVTQIQERLDQRFQLLAGGNRAEIPHHQTLRALIDWSYDLLTPEEQTLFQWCSVFAGGWNLEMVEQLSTNGDVLDLLEALVDKSLVIALSAEAPMRYQMLETLRDYSAEKLRESGFWDLVHQRHCDLMVTLMSNLASRFRHNEQLECLASFDQELGNLRAALSWGVLEDSTPERALQLCGKLYHFWVTRGSLQEGRDWCTQALNRAGAEEPTKSRADALTTAGIMTTQQGDYPEARLLHSEALAIRQQLGDKRGIAFSLDRIGNLDAAMGDLDAGLAMLEESLALYRECEYPVGVAALLGNIGNLHLMRGEDERARTHWLESLALMQSWGGRLETHVVLQCLAYLAKKQGDSETYRQRLKECLAIQQELGDRNSIAFTMLWLGSDAELQGDLAEASRLRKESLTIYWELQNRLGLSDTFHAIAGQTLIGLSPHDADYLTRCRAATRLLAAMEELLMRRRISAGKDMREKTERLLLQLAEALGKTDFDTEWLAGQAMPLDQVVALAFTLLGEQKRA